MQHLNKIPDLTNSKLNFFIILRLINAKQMCNQNASQRNNSSSSGEDLDKEEDDLVEKLKKICDKNGKELEPTKSAAVFHQLAKIYQKRQPELITHRMICVVKSAALFNAAIVRSDDSQNIESDLKDLCSEILHEAGAKQKDADLIEQVNIVAAAIKKMRDKVKKTLNELSHIPNDISKVQRNELEAEKTIEAELLLKGIARDYKNIMAGVAKFVENVMGEPPCEFSLAGMGSLAREEITPYSDFENMLILNPHHGYYKHLLNYFRWYSVIFQTILINLRETIIPSVFISLLNDKNSKHGDWFFDNITKRGICFDGMMPHACKFPLGRQQLTEAKPWATELIKPVNEMLKYLNSEESLKNGYHLSTILTKTCYVYGNVKVYEEFDKGVRDLIEQEKPETIKKSVARQVTEDLAKFAARQSLPNIKPAMQFNVKQIVYRSSTILISELGRLHKIPSSSCFDILRELANKSLISNSAKQNLMFAVALACEVRLKWYMQNKKQGDSIDSIETFVSLIGKQATLRYFRIAYALQCHISKQLNLKRLHLYSNPILLNVSLYRLLKDHSKLREILRDAKENRKPNQRYYDFDECLSCMEKNISLKQEQSQDLNDKSEQDINSEILKNLGDVFCDIDCFDDAIECYQNALEVLQYNRKESQATLDNQLLQGDVTRYGKTASILFDVGLCLRNLFRYQEAKLCFDQSLFIRQKISSSAETDSCIAESLCYVGECLTRMNKLDDAILCFEKSLQIREKILSDIKNDTEIAVIFFLKAECLYQQSLHVDALSYFMKSLFVKKFTNNAASDIRNDHWIAQTLTYIGEILIFASVEDVIASKKMLSNLTLVHLKQHKFLILEAAQNSANTSNYSVSRKLEDAKLCLEKSLSIQEKVSPNVLFDRYISRTTYMIGTCLWQMDKVEEAIIFYEKSLKIKTNLSLDPPNDGDLAITVSDIGDCWLKLKKPEGALKYFKRAFNIQKKLSSDVTTDDKIAASAKNIAVCLLDLKMPMEAQNYFETFAEIQDKLSHAVATDIDVAETAFKLGCCFMDQNQPHEAQDFLERSLQIYEKVSFDAASDSQIAINTYNIGICLLDEDMPLDAISNFEKALQIYEQISDDKSSDASCGNTLYMIGRCFMEINEVQTAMDYLEEALKITTNASADTKIDSTVANIQYCIGICLFEIKKTKQALNCFEKCLQIERTYTNTTKNEESISLTHEWISQCREKIQTEK